MQNINQAKTVVAAIAIGVHREVADKVVAEHSLQIPGAGSIETLVVECRCASDDAIEILWVALC